MLPLFKDFFLMWTIFKVLIEFVTILFVFWFFGHKAMQDPNSLTRNQTHTSCIVRRSLNHWTAREVPNVTFFKIKKKNIETAVDLVSYRAFAKRCHSSSEIHSRPLDPVRQSTLNYALSLGEVPGGKTVFAWLTFNCLSPSRMIFNKTFAVLYVL